MKNAIKINEKDYFIEQNIKEGFVLNDVEEKMTDYFDDYDYIVGDWAYGKLRLKGFYEQKNQKVKNINNIKFLEKYLKEQCAFGCKYFVLKRVYKP